MNKDRFDPNHRRSARLPFGASDERALLYRALTSRSFLARNLMRSLLRGKRNTAAYWHDNFQQKFLADVAHLKPGLGIFGLFNAEIGLGSAARGFARSLATTDIAHSCTSLHVSQYLEERVAFEAGGHRAADYQAVMFYFNPDILLRLDKFLDTETLASRRKIVHWAWELPVFPAAWASAPELVDEIWVASSFVAESVATATQKPIRIVPYAVEATPHPKDEARRDLGLPADALIFLTTFDFNSFPSRKNPLAAIRAFRDAFPYGQAGDEILVVKSHGRSNREHAKPLVDAAAGDPRIIWIDQVFSERQIQQLQSAADAFISLHRSEGFGLNIAECMGLGLPAVATNFSGATEFLTSDNSFPIGYTARPLARGDYHLGDGQWWAEPDHDDAVDALRIIRNDPPEAARRGSLAKQFIAERFSFEAVGRIAKAAFEAGA